MRRLEKRTHWIGLTGVPLRMETWGPSGSPKKPPRFPKSREWPRTSSMPWTHLLHGGTPTIGRSMQNHVQRDQARVDRTARRHVSASPTHPIADRHGAGGRGGSDPNPPPFGSTPLVRPNGTRVLYRSYPEPKRGVPWFPPPVPEGEGDSREKGKGEETVASGWCMPWRAEERDARSSEWTVEGAGGREKGGRRKRGGTKQGT